MTQKRIIIKDRTGQLLSLPEDYSMPFYAVVDGKQEETQQRLGQIIDQHAMSAAKIQVKPVSGKSISFSRGAAEEHCMVMDIYDWETTYDERYLVGNSVVYEMMSTIPTVIPIWMPISLTVATGFSDGSFEDYRKFLDKMSLATKNFQNSKVTGIKDIIVFKGKLSDYEEGRYDTITPFVYRSIGQFSRPPRAVTSSTHPDRPPLRPPLNCSVADGGGKRGPKLPDSKPNKSMFSLFKKSKSTDSAPEHQYEKIVSGQKSDEVHPYMTSQVGGTEQSDKIYMEATVTEQRSLPPIPADEHRKQRNESRSRGKTVQTVSKPPLDGVFRYKPLEIGTDKGETPAPVKPEEPPQTKLVPPNPQEEQRSLPPIPADEHRKQRHESCSRGKTVQTVSKPPLDGVFRYKPLEIGTDKGETPAPVKPEEPPQTKLVPPNPQEEQRSLPPIPADEHRKQRHESCSRGKTVQTVSKPPLDGVFRYKPLEIGTDKGETPAPVKPEEPPQTKLVPPNPQEEQRSLPPIPADEHRKQRHESRSRGKTVQIVSKPPLDGVFRYKPLEIGTDKGETPAPVKPEEPPQTKLVPPNPQEGGSVYGDYSDLPQSIEGMSVSEISECLALLKMTRHVNRFKESDVDGSLLNALSREILLEEFNFTEFEVTKLMKFKRGWRPKT